MVRKIDAYKHPHSSGIFLSKTLFLSLYRRQKVFLNQINYKASDVCMPICLSVSHPVKSDIIQSYIDWKNLL